MAGKYSNNISPGGPWDPSQQYPSPPPPAPPKKPSLGKRILTMLVTIAVVIVVKIGLHAVLGHHHQSHHAAENGFDYAVGTCLDFSKASSFVKPGDVRAVPCSSPTALAKVAKKYTGTKNCPTGNYGTLEGGGSGLCLQDNLTVGSCYREALLSHMFKLSECTAGFTDPTYRVALRRDGVNDPGLCTGEQVAVNFPEPPLTYCMDALLVRH